MVTFPPPLQIGNRGIADPNQTKQHLMVQLDKVKVTFSTVLDWIVRAVTV